MGRGQIYPDTLRCLYQGVIQSAFLWGYMATQLFGGTMADKYGGKRVMAFGIAWFSIASLLMPLALSAPVVAAGMTLPALLAARCMVVGAGLGVDVGMHGGRCWDGSKSMWGCRRPLSMPPLQSSQPLTMPSVHGSRCPYPAPHCAPLRRAWARGWLCPR